MSVQHFMKNRLILYSPNGRILKTRKDPAKLLLPYHQGEGPETSNLLTVIKEIQRARDFRVFVIAGEVRKGHYRIDPGRVADKVLEHAILLSLPWDLTAPPPVQGATACRDL